MSWASVGRRFREASWTPLVQLCGGSWGRIGRIGANMAKTEPEQFKIDPKIDHPDAAVQRVESMDSLRGSGAPGGGFGRPRRVATRPRLPIGLRF